MWPFNESPTQKYFDEAERFRQNVLDRSSHVDEHLETERDGIMAMEEDVIKLKAAFKNEPAKLLRLAKDWRDFAEAVYQVKSAREMLDADMEVGANDRYDASTKDSFAIIRAMGDFVNHALRDGSEYHKFIKKLENTQKRRGLL